MDHHFQQQRHCQRRARRCSAVADPAAARTTSTKPPRVRVVAWRTDLLTT